MNTPELGALLRRLRKLTGLTQQMLAEALQISRSTYTYYESGKITPDLPTLQKLAKIFGVSPALFFHPEDFSERQLSPPPPPKNTHATPTHLNQLRPEEKKLIAKLRAESLDVSELKEELEGQKRGNKQN